MIEISQNNLLEYIRATLDWELSFLPHPCLINVMSILNFLMQELLF